jgi:hypothetical protein
LWRNAPGRAMLRPASEVWTASGRSPTARGRVMMGNPAVRRNRTRPIGRSERIRTSGPCVPNTVLYQAELHSGRDARIAAVSRSSKRPRDRSVTGTRTPFRGRPRLVPPHFRALTITSVPAGHRQCTPFPSLPGDGDASVTPQHDHLAERWGLVCPHLVSYAAALGCARSSIG